MKAEWRPDDWENSYDKQREEDGMFSQAELYEAGASAMLAAVLKWLDEPCDKHLEYPNSDSKYPTLRIDCPQCMNELRGEE